MQSSVFYIGDRLTTPLLSGALVAVTPSRLGEGRMLVGESLASWRVGVPASSCTLVERGPGYHYLSRRGEESGLPTFSAHQEEVNFWLCMLLASKVANPETGLFTWTVAELIHGLLDERIDFYASNAEYCQPQAGFSAFVVHEPLAKKRLGKNSMKAIIQLKPASTT